MYGSTPTKVARAVGHMLMRPHHGVRWIGGVAQRRGPVQLRMPWISYPAIDFLMEWLQRGMKVHEWGAGGSTLFFLDRGCEVTTVETEQVWLDRVARRHSFECWHPKLAALAAAEYVQPEGKFDVIMIDGPDESRAACAQQAVAHLATGGIVVVDDAWREQYEKIPEILSGMRRQMFVGLGPSRLGVTQTDIYFMAR